jgi:integrase
MSRSGLKTALKIPFWEFFREFNGGLRVVSPEEEEKLLRNASPCIQDLVRFALSTGLRIGEIFSLRWSDVDSENNVLNILAPKTQKIRAVPKLASRSWISTRVSLWRAKKRELKA